MLAKLYESSRNRGPSMLWAARRMRLAADNFEVLASWIAFPKSDTIVHVKSRAVAYTNAMTTGTYDELPSQVLGEDAGLIRETRRASRWRRGADLLGLFVSVSLPLAVFAAVVTYLGRDLPSALHPPAAIVYSAWVVLCLIAYVDRLAPDAKTTILDIIRLVFRR